MKSGEISRDAGSGQLNLNNDFFVAQTDRLLDILKQSEDEKHSKDAQIKDLQEYVLSVFFVVLGPHQFVLFPLRFISHQPKSRSADSAQHWDSVSVSKGPDLERATSPTKNFDASAVVFDRKSKDTTNKLTAMKRNQQTEKTNSAQLLEEARMRENQMTEDMTKLEVREEEESTPILNATPTRFSIQAYFVPTSPS